jgi:hypothetical protein
MKKEFVDGFALGGTRRIGLREPLASPSPRLSCPLPWEGTGNLSRPSSERWVGACLGVCLCGILLSAY